jgi:hypothetical protein
MDGFQSRFFNVLILTLKSGITRCEQRDQKHFGGRKKFSQQTFHEKRNETDFDTVFPKELNVVDKKPGLSCVICTG